MNAALRLAYGAAAHLARAAAAMTPDGATKWRRSLRARRGIRNRYAAWQGRDPSRPLLWMHAPSVGEGLQARVVLELVRARRPDIQLAYTFFSPSAERFASALDVDFVDYLPFDTAGDALVVTDARRREVYWARYRDGVRVDGPAVDAPADVPGAEDALSRPPIYPTVAGLVRAVTDWTAEPAPLIPLYLRRPDAKPSVVTR